MAAATLNVPILGIEDVEGYRVQVQRRPGATAVWLTLLGEFEPDNMNLGTVVDLHTDDPQVRVFQRCARWATPAVRSLILAAAIRMYRKDEATHSGS